MRIFFLALLALAIGGASFGCSPTGAPPSQKPARVSATPAFEKYFGPAPSTDKGTCYAFVIYFPRAGAQGRVTPFPFFSFDEASLKKVALERMLGGMEEGGYAGQFPQLFPKGTRLLSLTQSGATVTAEFSKELEQVARDPARWPPLRDSVSLTLLQFPGIAGVRLQSEGNELFAAGATSPVEERVVEQPAAPRLLKVTAMKETKASDVQEVDALFDRPVEIKQLQFLQEDGAVLAGEVYHAMFDMAAVLKPRNPERFLQGTKVRVRYQVVDKVGRSASGDAVFPLEVKQHQD